MTKEKVSIQVCGRSYQCDSNLGDGLYISALARYVEEKMQEVAISTNINSTYDQLMLVALNITDELFRLRENNDSVNKKTGELLNLLDAVLE